MGTDPAEDSEAESKRGRPTIRLKVEADGDFERAMRRLISKKPSGDDDEPEADDESE